MSGDADFADFMARDAAAKAAAAEHAERMARHQLWKETTWGGKFSTFLTSLGDRPFFQAVIKALEDQQQGTSVPALLLRNFARLAIIFAAILAVYILGKIIQMVVGKEITAEQKVVIVEEVTRGEAEKENKKKATTQTKPRRSARQKKTD